MNLRLQEIIAVDDLRELMLFFHEAAGISVGVMDEKQNWLVTIGWQHICTDFHRVNPTSRKNCLLSEQRISEYLNTKEYLSYPCPNGLVEVAIPILLHETLIGFFFLGQFLYQPPDIDYFRRQAIAYGYDVEAYLQALKKIPVVSKQRVDHLMRFFSLFFDLLTRLGAENQKRLHAESEIQKAKEELEVRVEERTRDLNRALLEVGDLAFQLNTSLQQIESLAVTDSLTNTYNRRKFDEVVAVEHGHGSSEKAPFSLIMLDIDYFKKVNDRFGHSAGDDVLKHLCHLIRGVIRQGDLLIRWGGEEFMLLLPTTEIAEAEHFAERIRVDVEAEKFSTVGHITISLGVAEFQKDDSVDALLKRVDNALYQAKQGGRNRVVKCVGG
ncbi:diguanylate cyclase (GGDEF) domain-containing protein [Desulfuromusa kysingii]|uniref:diguanylate cyclase n=1 Tax=Desulfuromusa kysingii TaxID=37625 RepID=A0A1H4BZI1_9BACT|nr:diguanylate cyclase [Desulfuromusa kysingii]SEA53516.1 diguanylate cyclase (GGDEF) domain-containing protein [Desulfuromusa kysingii]